MGERFECSTVGRVVLTVVMGVLAAAILLFNLPPGQPRAAVYPVAARVLFPFGLDLDAALFAPEPRNASVGLYARISYADGRELIWKPPDRGHVLAPYRTYRWQKYIERARADDFQNLWEPTARWLAQEMGPGVTKVALVRTFQYSVTPGSGQSRGEPGEFEYYTLELP